MDPRDANLGIRFVLELAALISIGAWAFQAAPSIHAAVLMALALPGLAVLVWGTWVAPRSRRRLPDPWRLVPELVVFGSGVGAMWGLGWHAVAIADAVLVAVSVALLFAWDQRGL